MKLLAAFSCLALLHTCHPVPAAHPPASTKSEAPLAAATGKRDSVIAAYAQAAHESNELNPDGAPKEATRGAIAVVQAQVGVPDKKDLDVALALKDAALAGDIKKAQDGWAVAQADAVALRNELTKLKADVEAERKAAALENQRQLDAVRSEEKRKADAKLNMLLQIGTFGLGALCLVGAIVAANLAVSIPILGPNIVKALGAAGIVLIGMGLVIRSVDRFVDQHPQLFFGGLVAAVLALIVAGALAWSNHHHTQVASPAIPQA